MTVPRGLFAPGGPPLATAAGRMGGAGDGTGIVMRAKPLVPLEWLRAHPATRRWIGRALDTGVGATFITRQLVKLQDGFEGYLKNLMLVGGWNAGVANTRNWTLLVDGAPAVESRIMAGATVNSGAFDLLPGGSDGTNTWGELDLWLSESATVTISYNNSGGNAADQLGAVAMGYYWPVVLREEWLARGWKR